ncbi:unnamed protein product [Bemisia tabaci]|uniref:Myb-like, SWIRM and MPN domain-containing protein 1 n=1 Tax=Bemisia tabaci TaxID=7038 RepID=A0A9P0ABS8_BEMTA|nr:unnamed protein product [Bemisia tabaci]
MDDYDEVLSDFNFENLFLKADSSLHANYDSVELLHNNSPPGGHWFLESNLNAFWSKTLGSDPEDKGSFSCFSTSPQSKFLDSLSIANNNAWSSKEKYLLEKGLELFGRSWIRLSQYIGSKTSSQIKAYVLSMEQNTGHNTAAVMNPTSSYIDFTELGETEIINEMQIPASMEEVITAVSTGQPTIPSVSNRCGQRQRFNSTSSSDSESRNGSPNLRIDLEFGSSVKNKPQRKRCRTTLKRNKSIPVRKHQRRKTRQKSPNIIFIKPKEEVSQFHIKIAESGHNKNKVILPSGEEVVKIKNESPSDNSDVDIDIEDTSDSEVKPIVKVEFEENDSITNASNAPDIKKTSIDSKLSSPIQVRMNNLREKICAIHELPPPSCERKLSEEGHVTEDEKKFHPEFFEKNDPILMSRYLKIRNHIYKAWLANKPNYVYKSAIRAGLKGDVNLISRVHTYLEQCGYINFGCGQCHYNQRRDLINVKIEPDESDDPLSSPRGKSDSALSPIRRKTSRNCSRISSYSTMLEPLPKFEVIDEGGCTIQHMNSNETVISCFGSGNLPEVESTDKSIVELISCKQYAETHAVPINVKMSLESLLLIDIHSHSSKEREVIGLLGGRYDANSSTLFIVSASACKTDSSSNVHCDMCPVSQSDCSERIYAMGQEIVGWYHSHPTFLPDPSHQDIETQQGLQSWFWGSAGLPFVGFILSPFLKESQHQASMLRCLTVEKSEDGEITPFELNVELYCDLTVDICFALSEQLKFMLLNMQNNASFSNPLNHQCMESVLHHIKSIEPAVPEEFVEQISKSILQTLCTLDQK